MAGNPDITILLTRPEAQAATYARHLVDEFGDRVRPVIAPLLAIRQLPVEFDPAGVSHILFTSLNAVESLAAQSGCRDVPCLCVGDRTAETARHLGFSAESAGGAADDLLRLVKRRMIGKTGALVYMRGRRVASDLALELGREGYSIRDSIVYEQVDVGMSDKTKSMLESGEKVLVPLFSPHSASRFMAETGGLSMPGVTAIAISENAARLLDPARLSSIRLASHPTAEAITREIAAIL